MLKSAKVPLRSNMKRLSIIIPMYNVEAYIERCIRSLEEQNIPKKDYEIICINDGSPDNCRNIVIELQEQFENIILIDQINQGVSVARNNGIDISSGTYILMVDPDDYVTPNAFMQKLDILEKYDLDLGLTGYSILDEKEKEEYRFEPIYGTDINVLRGIDYFNRNLRGRTEIRDPHRSVAIFFKSGFLNTFNIRYLPDVPYLEDAEIMTRILCLAQKVSYINDPFYQRTTRPGSATHSSLARSEYARNGFLKAATNHYNFKISHCSEPEQKIFMNQSIIHFTILVITSLGIVNYFKYRGEFINSLKRGVLKKLETEGTSKQYKKLANSYNCSIDCLFIYNLLSRIKTSLRIRFMRTKKLLDR